MPPWNSLSRRRILKSTLAVSTGFAGCINVGVDKPRYSPERALHLVIRNVSKEEETWQLSVEVQAHFHGQFRGDDAAIFENVAVIARTASSNVVGKKTLGDLGPSREVITTTMTCSERPNVVQITTAEAPPCNDHTEIQARVYSEANSTWKLSDSCSESHSSFFIPNQ